MKNILVGLAFLLCSVLLFAGNEDKQVLFLQKGEKVWTGVVNDGARMPLKPGYKMDFKGDNKSNQVQPLILTTAGQYVWCEEPFAFEMKEDCVEISSTQGKIIMGKVGSTLREARQYVADTFFPASGLLPDTILFSSPQYNTWIELNYNQNQEDVLKYARAILDNGFPPGVITIDDSWQEDFGVWKFHPKRFPDPKKMIGELHRMGFKVSLWVCPFVSPDQEHLVREFRENNPLLLRNVTDKWGNTSQVPYIIQWWNGYSAILDMSNPDACKWFEAQLNFLMEEDGIDGFKFDGGNMEYYPDDAISYGDVNSNLQCQLYAELGLKYSINEFRASWKLGGKPLVQRLIDKQHDWNDLRKLIPEMIVEGFCGHYFTLPDMIGGGEISAFEGRDKLDQDLVVRSAQCQALMPMMQFSVAPWRVLDEKHMNAIKKVMQYREQFKSLILDLAHNAASVGEPVLRSMDYVFPGEGFETEVSQFMLGDRVLVAPMLEAGKAERMVVLPKGKWKDEFGIIYKGGRSHLVQVPLERLPYFIKQK